MMTLTSDVTLRAGPAAAAKDTVDPAAKSPDLYTTVTPLPWLSAQQTLVHTQAIATQTYSVVYAVKQSYSPT